MSRAHAIPMCWGVLELRDEKMLKPMSACAARNRLELCNTSVDPCSSPMRRYTQPQVPAHSSNRHPEPIRSQQPTPAVLRACVLVTRITPVSLLGPTLWNQGLEAIRRRHFSSEEQQIVKVAQLCSAYTQINALFKWADRAVSILLKLQLVCSQVSVTAQ